MAETPQIVFYHYVFSPYALRIKWFLQLHGLPYSECLQPMTMPRPDLGLLGIRHRRIPVLSIGRDIYVDTPLMLHKLEQLVGAPTAALRPEQRAIEKLLDVLTVDSGMFLQAAGLILAKTPLIRDPVFLKDRSDYLGKPAGASAGKSSSKEEAVMTRAEALVELRTIAAFIESTLLADSRDWILNTAKPSTADIKAIWPFQWLTGLPGTLSYGSGPDGEQDEEQALSPAQFPRFFAWMARFKAATEAAQKAHPPTSQLSGEQAAAAILAASYHDKISTESSAVDTTDPVVRAAGFRPGQRVVVWPTDTGMSGRDVGRLLQITKDEVVLEVDVEKPPSGAASSVRLHTPRHHFTVRPYTEEDSTESSRL